MGAGALPHPAAQVEPIQKHSEDLAAEPRGSLTMRLPEAAPPVAHMPCSLLPRRTVSDFTVSLRSTDSTAGSPRLASSGAMGNSRWWEPEDWTPLNSLHLGDSPALSRGQATVVPPSLSRAAAPPASLLLWETVLRVGRRNQPHQSAEGPRHWPECCWLGLLGSADQGGPGGRLTARFS